MATYRVWLTVKDRYGNIKELDGGTIDVGLDNLTTEEVEVLDKHYATDAELNTAIQSSKEDIPYAGFDFENQVEVEGF